MNENISNKVKKYPFTNNQLSLKLAVKYIIFFSLNDSKYIKLKHLLYGIYCVHRYLYIYIFLCTPLLEKEEILNIYN